MKTNWRQEALEWAQAFLFGAAMIGFYIMACAIADLLGY